MRRRRANLRSKKTVLLLLAIVTMSVGAIAIVLSLDSSPSRPVPDQELTHTSENPLIARGPSAGHPTDLRDQKGREEATEVPVGKPNETAITFSEEELKTSLYEDDGSATRRWLTIGLFAACLSIGALYRYRRRRQRHQHHRRHHRRHRAPDRSDVFAPREGASAARDPEAASSTRSADRYR